MEIPSFVPSKREVEQVKRIYFEKSGIELSDAEAADLTQRLCTIYWAKKQFGLFNEAEKAMKLTEHRAEPPVQEHGSRRLDGLHRRRR